ncbi:MAG TPA: ornithine carbamoyltransferase, partial [Aciduliprofundum sp.]|nr:ornithine carbamoyltransferase [Aciduliprofundum sp.]
MKFPFPGVKHVLSVLDLVEELPRLIELTSRIKENPRGYSSALVGKSVALIFEKHSTRTRVSLEVAVSSMGGHPLYLPKEQLQLGRGEPIEDTARVLSGMVDAIAYRAYSHETMLRLALNSDVPVINALDDEEHPLQALADVYTIQELKGRVRGLKVAFVGDGNNVMVSLMLAVTSLGGDFWAAIPEGYDPPEEKVAIAEELASS